MLILICYSNNPMTRNVNVVVTSSSIIAPKSTSPDLFGLRPLDREVSSDGHSVPPFILLPPFGVVGAGPSPARRMVSLTCDVAE